MHESEDYMFREFDMDFSQLEGAELAMAIVKDASGGVEALAALGFAVNDGLLSREDAEEARQLAVETKTPAEVDFEARVCGMNSNTY